MRTIHKFKLNGPTSSTVLNLPIGAELLHVNEQNGVLQLWAEVDVVPVGQEKDLRYRERKIIIYGTGQSMEKGAHIYINTFFDGPYVWHAYEIQL